MASASPSPARYVRTLVTPEGVDLRLRLATGGQRAGAFVIDMLLLTSILIAFTIAMLAGGIGLADQSGRQFIEILWLLGAFLLRNFYFIFFEMGPRAATIGKRMAGLRVVARDGGRLTADAVVARNLMREIEVFLPLSFLAGGEDVAGVMALIGFLWAGIFLFFPLFNRDRLRVGDIVAGTWVVHAPRRRLEADLAEQGAGHLPHFAFTDAQLDAYGEYELQTLETVLRSRNEQTQQAVAETIRAKIGWTGPGRDGDFLAAYYAALSRRLERRMLFGRRRRDKYDAGEQGSAAPPPIR